MAIQRIAEGRRVLVVEDEMTIALMIEEMLLDLGAEVIGPESRLDAALRLAGEASIDAAILDVNIRGGNSYPVADVLVQRGIPFIFCSGYNDWALEERHRDRPRLMKPYSLKELEDQLIKLLGALSKQ
ncbi:response regulator [Pseudomonas sp. ERGC3:05]|nr:response regulator [Pseudomonas sp. ERGC3:01]QZC95366.1 response regulator [Pseudomonas sp. ERGC3:05]